MSELENLMNFIYLFDKSYILCHMPVDQSFSLDI